MFTRACQSGPAGGEGGFRHARDRVLTAVLLLLRLPLPSPSPSTQAQLLLPLCADAVSAAAAAPVVCSAAAADSPASGVGVVMQVHRTERGEVGGAGRAATPALHTPRWTPLAPASLHVCACLTCPHHLMLPVKRNTGDLQGTWGVAWRACC